MPLSRPRSLSAASRVAGDIALPSIETASPLSKPTTISVTASGASIGEMVRW